jgi:RecB family endonuclease NucS
MINNMEFRETIWNEHPEWNTIEFISSSGNITLNVCSNDQDDEVEINISEFGVTHGVYLTQDNIKQLINHLQKQLK